MRKIVCDECGSTNAKSYSYEHFPTRAIYYKDLCVNCLQEFVLKNQVKLREVQRYDESPQKRIIHG